MLFGFARVDLFEETQRPHILKAGWQADEIHGFEVVPTNPTPDCEYYQHKTALAPILIKKGASPAGAGASPKGARSFSSAATQGVHALKSAVREDNQTWSEHNWTPSIGVTMEDIPSKFLFVPVCCVLAAC